MGYLFRDLYIYFFRGSIRQFCWGVYMGPHEELTAGYPKNDDLEFHVSPASGIWSLFRINVFRDYTSL